MIQIEPLIHIEDLKQIMGISSHTLYKKIREQHGFPKGVKVNGKRFFRPSEIKNYYQSIGVDITISESGN
jgi:predicted DNA-binding transcriptional regulator AlpA